MSALKNGEPGLRSLFYWKWWAPTQTSYFVVGIRWIWPSVLGYLKVPDSEILKQLWRWESEIGCETCVWSQVYFYDAPVSTVLWLIRRYVRNTTARAFAVVASALGIPSLLLFLRAVRLSMSWWQMDQCGFLSGHRVKTLTVYCCTSLQFEYEMDGITRPFSVVSKFRMIYTDTSEASILWRHLGVTGEVLIRGTAGVLSVNLQGIRKDIFNSSPIIVVGFFEQGFIKTLLHCSTWLSTGGQVCQSKKSWQARHTGIKIAHLLVRAMLGVRLYLFWKLSQPSTVQIEQTNQFIKPRSSMLSANFMSQLVSVWGLSLITSIFLHPIHPGAADCHSHGAGLQYACPGQFQVRIQDAQWLAT